MVNHWDGMRPQMKHWLIFPSNGYMHKIRWKIFRLCGVVGSYCQPEGDQ